MNLDIGPMAAVAARLCELAKGLKPREQQQLDKHWHSLPMEERRRHLHNLSFVLNSSAFAELEDYATAFPTPPTDEQLQRCASYYALVYQKNLIKYEQGLVRRILAACKKLGTPVYNLPTFTKPLEVAKPGGAFHALHKQLVKSQERVLAEYLPARFSQLRRKRAMRDATAGELSTRICQELRLDKSIEDLGRRAS